MAIFQTSGSDMYNCFDEQSWAWWYRICWRFWFSLLEIPQNYLFWDIWVFIMYYIYGSVWAIPTYRVYRLYDKNVCCTLARFFCFIYRILISVSLLMKILLMNHLLSNLQMILFTSLHHPLHLDVVVPYRLLAYHRRFALWTWPS